MEEEAPLNKKNITEEITGQPYNFDQFDTEEPHAEEPTPDTPHPLVGVMDMMISASVQPLQKHGYPAPNVGIWEEWGKPNLSKAFYAYLPMDSAAGAAVSSPAFAGVLGLGALGIAFMPCILHHVDVKKKERDAEEERLRTELSFPQDEAAPAEPMPEPTPEPKPVPTTESAKLGWERVNSILESQK